MLITGLDIALKHGKEFTRLYLDSWNEVVNGEIDEVDFNKNGIKFKNTSTKAQIFEAYNRIINMKTASLFSSACKGGALQANMSEDIMKVFADYGREIGLAYQLADDLVDLAKGEFIDSVIIPILNKLEKQKIELSALKKEEIKNKFEKNKEKIKQVYIQEIKKHVNNAVQLSKSELIPSSEYKNMLTDAPRYIINKMLREINLTI
jgi:geranylgeranyl pyrophosphate synthase